MPRKRRAIGKTLAAVAIGLMGVASLAPAATAATTVYWNGATEQGVNRYSGYTPGLRGGSSSVWIGVGTNTVVNYLSYPGYTVLSGATSPNHISATVTHPATNAYSKCYWSVTGYGGGGEILRCEKRT